MCTLCEVGEACPGRINLENDQRCSEAEDLWQFTKKSDRKVSDDDNKTHVERNPLETYIGQGQVAVYYFRG